ncbi:MAG TPA: hypothetical protein VKQ71_06000 [Acidimicrobiales bacterium]|nr:hypothetical protein [Acidimicrobiales bacterium]
MTSPRIVQTTLLALVIVFMVTFMLGHAGMLATAAHDHTPGLAPTGKSVLPRLGKTLFAPAFPSGTRLISNDYAYFNPTNPEAVFSQDWIVTSGSLFARNRAGWTGIPDAVKPDAQSTNGTGSAIFRIVTRRRDFDTVAVSFDLLNQQLLTTPKTPARNWDGIHLFLHYHSQHSLYALTINRRDDIVIVKKKQPGGPANGGSYYTLGNPVRYQPPLGHWQHVLATITTNPNDTVTITAYLNGQLLLTRTDNGTGGPPLTGPGAIGLRGDNTEFEFTHFRINALG